MRTVTSTRILDIETAVRASPQQVSCDVADEAVLLSMCDGEYYGLNEVAASIWKQIQEPRTVSEVRDALLAEYDGIDERECERVVAEFLTEMLATNRRDTHYGALRHRNSSTRF